MIHELNCGTLHPPARLLVNGRGNPLARATLGCRCLLVPRGDDWWLVDTGLGTRDLADPVGRLRERFLRLNHPVLDPRETAPAQVVALGIDPRRVTDIVLTHHDVDHVGGIADFAWARVHLSRAQLDLVVPRLDPALVNRLRPAQWAHGPRWTPHDLTDTYRGRPASRLADGLWLVGLDGHVAGHCGVVVERPDAAPLVHAGDAIFALGTLDRRPAPPGLAVFERVMRTDPPAWRRSRAWLRDAHADGLEVTCAHAPAC